MCLLACVCALRAFFFYISKDIFNLLIKGTCYRFIKYIFIIIYFFPDKERITKFLRLLIVFPVLLNAIISIVGIHLLPTIYLRAKKNILHLLSINFYKCPDWWTLSLKIGTKEKFVDSISIIFLNA